jgi:hypothetical protein
MFIDHTHKPWIMVVLVLSLAATATHLWLPSDTTSGSWFGLFLGLVAGGSIVFAGLLPVGKRLARWKLMRLSVLQKGHIWLGLLSLVLVLLHGGFRRGGLLSTLALVVLAAIIGSGLAGLLFQHLLPLCKAGKEGKSKLAALLISGGHQFVLFLHVPLTLGLLALIAAHAVMALYF